MGQLASSLGLAAEARSNRRSAIRSTAYAIANAMASKSNKGAMLQASQNTGALKNQTRRKQRKPRIAGAEPSEQPEVADEDYRSNKSSRVMAIMRNQNR